MLPMRCFGGHGWRRVAATAVGFPITVALSGAVITVTGARDLDTVFVAIYLVPIALYGAVVSRAWTLALPLVWSAVFLTVLRVGDLMTGGCSVCGSDEDWGNYPFFFFFIAVVPMTVALLVGLAVGSVGRRVRR